MTKLSPDQVDQIVGWAEKGKSGLWIAARLGLKAATVNYRMLCAGFDPWPGQRNHNNQYGAFSPEEDQRLIELSTQHKLPTVAKLMNRARTSCRIRLMTLEVRAEKKLENAA